MHIGVAGLGRMGAAMAARLIEVGHQVTVWNRSPGKAKSLVDSGAKTAASPAALASAVETIITCLTDAEAIDKVFDGPSGILAGDITGKLVIEMSTVRPGVEIALAEKVRAKGAAFVECPVGGSTGPARQGKLIGLMGAEPRDAERAKPILDQLCRRIEHCGPVGAGEIMKFTINMPLMIYWQALGEALALSRPLGLDPDRVMDLLSDTSGGPNVLKVRGAAVAKMLKGGDPGTVTFDVESGTKDLRAMLAEGRARGLELPLVERSLACYEEASRHGLGLLVGPQGSLKRNVPEHHSSPRHWRCCKCPSRSPKPRPSSLPHSRKAATPIARPSRSRCSTPAAIWSPSSARTSPAFCGSTSPMERPGARSAWASARARWRSAPPARRSSSPCWRRRAAGASSPIRAAC